MFFGKSNFMNRKWVNNHVLDTFLKSLLKFVLALAYFGIGYGILTWMVGDLGAGETLPGSIAESPTRRTRSGGTVLVLISSFMMFLPYIMVFAGIINVIRAAVYGRTPFEQKALKKRFVEQYAIEFTNAERDRRPMHEAFTNSKHWIAYGCPDATQVYAENFGLPESYA